MTSTKEPEEVGQRLLRVDARGRVRTSCEEREAILDEFDQSGISGAGFAKLHGIPYSTFAHWAQKRRRRLGEQRDSAAEQPAAPQLALAEVVVDQEPRGAVAPPLPDRADDQKLRLDLPGGTSALVSNGHQLQLAVDLLRALSSSC